MRNHNHNHTWLKKLVSRETVCSRHCNLDINRWLKWKVCDPQKAANTSEEPWTAYLSSCSFHLPNTNFPSKSAGASNSLLAREAESSNKVRVLELLSIRDLLPWRREGWHSIGDFKMGKIWKDAFSTSLTLTWFGMVDTQTLPSPIWNL